MVSQPKPFSLPLSLWYARGGASFLFLPWSLVLWGSNVLVSWFGNSGVVDGLIGGGFDMGTRWWWVWLRLVMGRFVWWVWYGFGFIWIWWVWFGFGFIWVWWVDRFWFFFFFSYVFDQFNLRLVASVLVLVSLFWSSVLMGLLGFKNMNSHVLGRTWKTQRTSSSKKKKIIMKKKGN